MRRTFITPFWIKSFPKSPAETIRHRASGRSAFLPWEKNLKSAFPSLRRKPHFKLQAENNQTGQSNEKSDKSHHWRRGGRYAPGGSGGWFRNSFGGPEWTEAASRASPARVARQNGADHRRIARP